MNAGLWQHFEALCRSGKSENLLGDMEGCWTRRDSLAAALAIAKKIEDAAGSINSGSIIAIHLPRDRRYLATMFALWMRGNIMLPLNTAWPMAHIEHILKHSGADVVITADELPNRDFGNTSVVRLPGVAAITSLPQPRPQDTAQWQQLRAEQPLAYIIYTSGSTGEQKGVCISHAAFAAYTQWAGNYWSHAEYSALLITAELTFDIALGDIAFALAHDVEIHVSPDPGNFFSHAWLIRERKIDVVYSVPSTLTRLLWLCREREDVSVKGLKLAVSGGDVLPPNLIVELKMQAPNAEFYNVYGPTEVTINCFATRVDDITKQIESSKLVPIGRPFEHLDSLLHPETPGEIEGWIKGELLVGGIQSMEGYHGDGERSKQSFMFLNDRRYYRTGDLVCCAPDGLHYFLGRMDDLLKVSGYRINPVEIDNLLTREPDVLECKTVLVNSESGAPMLISFAVVSAPTDSEQLATRCREALPDYFCPNQIIIVDQLPLGISGKYDSGRLKALARETLLRVDCAAGR